MKTAWMERRDYVAAVGWTVLSFVICGIGFWYPPERYFDEIYYPRSAEEFIRWLPQYEWTHPPLTKLIIALSMILFGDDGFGWRFLNVVIGALLVFLIYVFAKRLTKSTAFASLAAGLMVFDGFHFTQSRIATPEITVALFSLFILYAFYRYWESAVLDEPAPEPPARTLILAGLGCLLLGAAVGGGIIQGVAHQGYAPAGLIAALTACLSYAVVRSLLRPRPRALGWLWLLAIVSGLGAASKWNDLFDFVLIFVFAAGIVLLPRLKWRLPFDAFTAIVLGTTIALYLAAYIPFFYTTPEPFIGRSDLNGWYSLQQQMFGYHDVTVTHNPPHPYSSKWWEWPLLIQPVAYWSHDFRTGAAASNPNACCVGNILSLPNPAVWWFGLISVPFLGFLAWRRRDRGSGLLFAAYFAQWLPWIASPRMLFEYHFFPNLAIIVLADTLLIQWLWQRAQHDREHVNLARIGIGLYGAGVVILFAYFYPILAGTGIPYSAWLSRMWLHHWIIGPG